MIATTKTRGRTRTLINDTVTDTSDCDETSKSRTKLCTAVVKEAIEDSYIISKNENENKNKNGELKKLIDRFNRDLFSYSSADMEEVILVVYDELRRTGEKRNAANEEENKNNNNNNNNNNKRISIVKNKKVLKELFYTLCRTGMERGQIAMMEKNKSRVKQQGKALSGTHDKMFNFKQNTLFAPTVFLASLNQRELLHPVFRELSDRQLESLFVSLYEILYGGEDDDMIVKRYLGGGSSGDEDEDEEEESDEEDKDKEKDENDNPSKYLICWKYETSQIVDLLYDVCVLRLGLKKMKTMMI